MLVALALALTAPNYPNLPVGAKWEGETTCEFFPADHPTESDTYVWKEDWKVTDIESGSVTLDCGRVLIKNLVDGKNVPLLPDMQPFRWKETWSNSGVKRTPELEDPSEFRTWRMRAIPPPHSRWSWPLSTRCPSALAEGNDKGLAVPKLADRKLASAGATFKEPSGISSITKGLRDIESGWMLEGSTDANGVLMPGGDGTEYRLKITWKTTKFEPVP